MQKNLFMECGRIRRVRWVYGGKVLPVPKVWALVRILVDEIPEVSWYWEYRGKIFNRSQEVGTENKIVAETQEIKLILKK